MSLMGRTNLTSLLRRTQASPGRFQGLGLLLGVLMLSLGPPARAHADEGLPRAMALLEYLPVGSRCRGFLPCEKSGDYGIHVRLLGALTLDEQRRVRQGLLAPSVQLSVMEAGECGVAFPLRFYELGQTVPERMRVFCQASLPRGLLPSGDGHEAAERFWDRALGPLRYRLRLRRRGYWDPYPDEQGLLRDEVDHSVLGLLGVPDPSRPGYILTPFGISIPVGASLEIRGDRPFVASPAFPGRVLTYIPLLALTPHGGALPRPVLDEIYFARLEDERRREELAVQDELRQMDSPWAKAALNAAVDFLTEPMRLFLAAASPDSPGLRPLKRQCDERQATGTEPATSR